MNKKELQSLALRGIDVLGYWLDNLGVTHRFNRHNLAASAMLWQWRLQGERDRVTVRFQRYRRRVGPLPGKPRALRHPS